MSEKRFIVLPNNVVWDNQLGEVVCRCILEGSGDAENVCQRLNEQQATINKQLGQIIELQDKYRILEFNHSRLEKRNKAQYEKIGEQQATISALKEENEQLRKELKEIKENPINYF